ncbi:hypothetical protein Presley_70 [Acinetobacter phage Presley]|uniref:Uncharacterized protein n=1 Tax=Acinetobacter phage Presley TaxID=1406780 RepID=U5PZR6_9CAUD|nr:hypothetical protein Presley_70 [Acinetobacter phage Presley]AGY48137.1 hypothetical protein Presley_70 [Acinetobacter phage Presley]
MENVNNEEAQPLAIEPDLLITEDQAKQMQQVNDIEHLGDLIGNWLLNTKNALFHVLDMPENEDPNDPENAILVLDPKHPKADGLGNRALTEEERVGFMFGIRYVLADYLDQFPVKFVVTDADGNVAPEYASQQVGGTTGEEHAPIENQND